MFSILSITGTLPPEQSDRKQVDNCSKALNSSKKSILFMLKILGLSALSDFRNNKLINELQLIDADIQSVAARFVHFIDLDKQLLNDEFNVLKRLLDYGLHESIKETERTNFLVTPRPGSISPWSSKATEIAQRCGLESIKRIERGVQFSLSLKCTQSLPEKVIEQILPLLP